MGESLISWCLSGYFSRYVIVLFLCEEPPFPSCSVLRSFQLAGKSLIFGCLCGRHYYL